MQLEIDDTTAKLIDMLTQQYDDEPVQVDLDVHTGHLLNEVAMRHYDWSRHVSALSLLISSRLLRAALETARERHPEG